LGISLAPPSSKAPEVLITFRSPRELKERAPSKAALLSASGVRPALRSSCGAAGDDCSGVDGAGAEAGSAAFCATGAGSSVPLLRAFWTAKTVAPRSATPRRARRRGRESAIGSHIGRRPALV
jgi:hypothetical protein